jgi:hypothetical protein
MEEVSIHGKLQSLVESEVPPKKKKDALLESEAATKPPVRRVVVMHLAYKISRRERYLCCHKATFSYK